VSDAIKRLQEQRANIFEGLKAKLDLAEAEGRDLTVEEKTDYDQRNADLDSLGDRIERLTDAEGRAADIAASVREVGSKPESRAAAAAEDKNTELRKFLTGEGPRGFDVRAGRPMGTEDFRTLSKLSAGAGANTVKTSFYEKLVAHLIEVSAVLQAGPTILNTSSGEALQIPKTTAHSSAALVAEAGTIGASDPTFGLVTLNAYKYALLMQVSHELVADTSVDLEGYLSMQAGRALGNALGTDLVVGNGTAKPSGVVQTATTGVTGGTAVVGAFTADNLIDLFYSVIAPYRNSPSCGWLMKDSTVATVRKFKDTTNQYIWQPSLVAGAPDTLLGKPLRTDPNVAATALNAKSVIFGDFSQYFVRLVENIRFEQSLDYAFNTDLISYRAVLRGDGILVDQTGAVKVFVGGAS
jgi:HK97 family phage major capsid protein